MGRRGSDRDHHVHYLARPRTRFGRSNLDKQHHQTHGDLAVIQSRIGLLSQTFSQPRLPFILGTRIFASFIIIVLYAMAHEMPWPQVPLTNKTHNDATVVIIGAGISGLCTAIDLLTRNKCQNFVILEKSSGLGGTWRDNKYPGCCCDGMVLFPTTTQRTDRYSVVSSLQLFV